MKFWFCEKCGKRVTDVDIAEGDARDKKAKGVYCTDCGVGINTVELDAITDEQLARGHGRITPQPPARKPSNIKITAYVPKARRSVEPRTTEPRAPATPSDKKSDIMMFLAGAGGIVIVGMAVMFLLPRGRTPAAPAPETQGKPAPTLAANAPATVPDNMAPLLAKPSADSAELPLSLDSASAAQREKDSAGWKKVQEIERIDRNDSAARIAAAEAFLRNHPYSAHAGRVTALLKRAKGNTTTSSDFGKLEPGTQGDRQQLLEDFALDMLNLYKYNRFASARSRVEKGLQDKEHAAIFDWLQREKKDLDDMLELRNAAFNALRADAGNTVTLKIGEKKLTGKLKPGPAADELLFDADGTERHLTAEKLDSEEVLRLQPVLSDANRGDALRLRGYLLLTDWNASGAREYFNQAAAAGLDVSVYRQWLKILDLALLELQANRHWNYAERYMEAKHYLNARNAYRMLATECASTRFYASKKDEVKERLAELEKLLPAP
jgi:hypothetical protein